MDKKLKHLKRNLKELEEGKKRIVWGTRTNSWHVIDKDDRDWDSGLDWNTFLELGEKEAKQKLV